MNKLSIVFNFLLFILGIFFSSCEDEIQVELRTAEPVLVIEGNVRMDSLAYVRITKTKGFAEDNTYLPVEGAMVKIWDDAGNYEILQLGDSGNYIANTIIGKEKVTYNLLVEYEGKEYTAMSYMPPRVAIDSLSLFEFPVLDYPLPMIHFQDPLGEENRYYRFLVYINGERPDISLQLLSTEFMDGLVIHNMIGVYTDDDDDPIEQGDELLIEMQCVDKDVFLFWETLSRIDNSLTNPTSNIQGGALGYFSAYSFEQSNILAVW